jgi:archaeosortase A (PGF-CTERM-specific)
VSLVAPVAPADVVFLVGACCMVVGSVAAARGREPVARHVSTAGWIVFAAFWGYTAVDYLGRSRYVLAGVGLLTAVVSGYAALLVAAERSPGRRLTAAFAATSVVFVPYQFLRPVYGAVVETTTWGTRQSLAALGYETTVLTGPRGFHTAIAFPDHDVVLQVVSACTGLSAVALFVGLLAVSRESRARRALGIAVVGPLVYLLNLVRMVLVSGAIPSEAFAATAPVVGPLFGVSGPAAVSFFFAEAILSWVLVLAALGALYVRLTVWFPDVDDLVWSLVDRASEDAATVRESLASRG